MNIYFCILEFFLAAFFVLAYYKFVETYKIKKFTKSNIPVDLKLFIYTQKINVKKISYKKLMRIVAIINAIDIGLILVITNLFSSFLLKFVISIPLIYLFIFGSYRIVGYILKKKGMTLND